MATTGGAVPSTPVKSAGMNPAYLTRAQALQEITRLGYGKLAIMAEALSFIDDQVLNLYSAILCGISHQSMNLKNANNLDSAFIWQQSPQGHIYWREIHEKLSGLSSAYRKARYDDSYCYQDLMAAMSQPGMSPIEEQLDGYIADGPAKAKPKEWQPDKADGSHVMNITREMF